MRDEKIKFIKEKLIELESLIGSLALKLMVQRIFYEMDKKGFNVPENVLNTDFSNLSEDEINNFFKYIVILVGEILGNDFKNDLIKEWEEKFGKIKNVYWWFW